MSDEIFDEVLEVPDPDLKDRYAGLVGVDPVKDRLLQEGLLLLAPNRLREWSLEHYGSVLPGVADLAHRPPLIILAGDVGTGKTALATSFPDALARNMGIDLTVFHLGLGSRGQGAVGEMTRRLGAAFSRVADHARQAGGPTAEPAHGAVLVIDEADSVAQSRDLDQMHHEDRAGVNAIIRGIDQLANPAVAAICVMCTNRGDAIDPAVQRRAALTLAFDRPTPEQRASVLKSLLGEALTDAEYDKLAAATGEAVAEVGYTFSDLRTRLVPEVLLRCLSAGPVTLSIALDAAESIEPTAPFGGA